MRKRNIAAMLALLLVLSMAFSSCALQAKTNQKSLKTSFRNAIAFLFYY